MSRGRKDKFVYRPRSPEELQKRASQSGGRVDPICLDQFDMFVPKGGDNRVRFLPPTWDNPDHYGLDLYVHYGVGADNQSYLCPAKMRDSKCPVCEERQLAEQGGDTEYAKKLSAKKRVLVWVINRDAEKDGPKLWAMPWTIDRDVTVMSIDTASGEVLAVDDPYEGYDVLFSKDGKGKNTKYIGLSIARRHTPIHTDEDELETIMEFVIENPAPEACNVFEYDHIAKVFGGQEDPEAGDGKEKRRGRQMQESSADQEKAEEEPEKPKGRSASGRFGRREAPEQESEQEEKPAARKKFGRQTLNKDSESAPVSESEPESGGEPVEKKRRPLKRRLFKDRK